MATTAPTAADERVRQTPWIRKVMARPELGAVAGTVLVFVFFGFVARGSGMFSALGVVNFLEVSAQLGIIAVAACMLMIGGEFDLSIGSMIGAAGVIIAIPAVMWGWPLWLCILLAFAVACLVGYINGTIVIRTGLPSFIVTLAALFILRGLTIGFTRLITGRTQVSGLGPLVEQDWLAPVFSGQVGYPVLKWMADVGIILARPDGEPFVQGIPMSIVWWLVLTVVCGWILLRTRVGNWIFAAGGDPVAARNVGVPVARVKKGLFMFTACAATLFACVQVLDQGSADVLRGVLKEFEAIIAAVIGGTLLTGGYGSVIGASFGALIFGTVRQGIFYTGVNTDWFQVFLGCMLLIAVIFNNYVRRKVTEAR
ncbi:MAG TPA: ABC transporter permease [Geminicoccaceae bacterium]|nr:ABC transporter permease [Geminicoccaceae bacterium]